jgi:hypothetical protein
MHNHLRRWRIYPSAFSMMPESQSKAEAIFHAANLGAYPRRTVYVLHDAKNRCLIDTEARVGPTFSDSPIVALRHGMAWLTKEVAIARLKTYTDNHKKGPPLSIRPVDVMLTSSGWEVAP